jgi:hypothetical protein
MRAFAGSNQHVGAKRGAADRHWIARRKKRVGLVELPRLAVVEFDLDFALFADCPGLWPFADWHGMSHVIVG